MTNIFPIDFEEKLTMAQDDYILFSDSEDGNKIKKAQYKNLKGEQGDPGTPGQDGEDGAAATITVGSVSTLPAGSSATVTNSGTTSAAVLNFGIPEGATGTPGTDGEDGAAATVTVGTTTTLPAGSSATVTNVGTSKDAIFNFGIPKGDSGSGSGDVNGPASSTDGHLAVFDGATGKIIKDGGAMPTIPTKVSELSNDSGFITGITSGDVTAALGYTPYDSSNPSGYITSSDIPTDVSDFNNDAGYLTSSTGVTSVNGNTGPVTIEEVPSGGTEGQVLTQTNNGPAWQNATGGADIEYVTQAEYNALLPGALTDNKHYFIYSTSGGGGGRQPSANTVLYLPLNGDVTDPYNNVTYNWGVGTASYGTWDGATQAANFTGSNAISLGTSLDLTGGTGMMTVCFWFTTASPSSEQRCSQNRNGTYFNILGIANSKVRLYVTHTDANTQTNIAGTTTLSANTKYLYTATIQSNGDIKLYLNGQLEASGTVGNLCSLNYQFGQWIGASREGDSAYWSGMIREFIVEDKIWTAQEIEDYYTATA